MRLWKIRVKHYSPKDSHEAIQGFLLRDTEEEVLGYVAKHLMLSTVEELNREVEIYYYDEDTDEEGQETITRREELLRNHGEIGLDSNDYSDAHYGITHYSWEEVDSSPSWEVLTTLKHLGLFIDKKETE